jgi:HEAT repeat protein
LEKTNALIFASRDPVWFVRLRIVKALGDLGAPDREPERTRYFDALTHLLYDDVWHVRRNAAAVLASGGEQGLAILHNIGSDVARSALAVREVYKGRDVATVL